MSVFPDRGLPDWGQRMRRFWDSRSTTCTYLLADPKCREGVLIDPVLEQVPLYLGVLDELGYRLAWVLDTHLHGDHASAAASLRALLQAQVGCGAGSGITGVDRLLGDGESLSVGQMKIDVLATPGHTPGCVTYRWEDCLFTGDALWIGGCGRTDEPGGNPGQLYDSVTRRLLPLPDEYLLFPGKGSQTRWVSCMGEERNANPLFRGVSRDEFIALCQRRPDPPPLSPEILHRFRELNSRCGRAQEGAAAPSQQDLPAPSHF